MSRISSLEYAFDDGENATKQGAIFYSVLYCMVGPAPCPQ